MKCPRWPPLAPISLRLAKRCGQTRRAQAVWDAMEGGGHLAVQAGTGTGKSLAYLVPALRLATDRRLAFATPSLLREVELVALTGRIVGTERFLRRRRLPAAAPFSNGEGGLTS